MSNPNEDDYHDWPVRPYMMTGGRAHPSRNTIRPETLVIANPDRPLPVAATRQQRALVGVCRGLLSLAEAAAHLGLPVSLVVVMVSDLADTGHLLVRSAAGPRASADRALLRKVLDGLRKL